MDHETTFWQGWVNLIATHKIILDRPKGSPHPRYPKLIYPLDYGYVEGTTASDGDGIDVWSGTLGNQTLTGILCTFDKIKRDAEIKLLIGCTLADVQLIQAFNSEMLTLFIPNPTIS